MLDLLHRDAHQTIIQLVRKECVLLLDFHKIQFFDKSGYIIFLQILSDSQRILECVSNIWIKMIYTIDTIPDGSRYRVSKIILY